MMKRWWIRWPVLLAGGYLLLLTALFFLQDRMLYHPWTRDEPSLATEAAQAGLQPWRAPDGRLIGWHTPERPGARVLLFHGNAGHAAWRAPILHRWARVSGVGGVWVMEYPGFGARPGPATEPALMAAAVEAIDLLARPEGTLLVAGESLGSAVAGQAAGARRAQVAGLLMLTPMNRLRDVARHHYPWMPVDWILRSTYDPAAALTGARMPMAVVVAEADTVVPAVLGRKLADGHHGPVRVWSLPDAGHNDLSYTPEESLWDEALGFLLDAKAPGD